MSKEIIQMISELKKSTLGSYIKKAASDGLTRSYISGGGTGAEDQEKNNELKTARKRMGGIIKATNKLTKEDLDQMSAEGIADLIENIEQLDELSRKTLAMYTAMAASDARNKTASAAHLKDESKYHKSAGHTKLSNDLTKMSKEIDDKASKRIGGVIKAASRIATNVKVTKEDINEACKVGDEVLVKTPQGDKEGKVHDITKTHIGVSHPGVKGAIHYHPHYVRKNIEEAFDETLMEGVSWERWDRSHSGSKEVKKSNRGQWMVSKHKDGYRYGQKEGDDHITVNGTGKEAAEAGAKWAKEKGHGTAYVLEAFTPEAIKSDFSLSSIANSALTTARKP